MARTGSQIEATYDYNNADGELQFQVVRRVGKKFSHRHLSEHGLWVNSRGDAPLVPYRLDAIAEDWMPGQPVWIFEGEKDVDRAVHNHFVDATCNSGGAGKWKREHTNALVELGCRDFIIVFDKDEAGRRHALEVEKSLIAAGAATVKFRCAAKGFKDFSDHSDAGFKIENLLKKRPKVQEQAESQSSDGTTERFLPAAMQIMMERLRKVSLESGKEDAQQFNACCPAHDDQSPSLSFRPGRDGDRVRVLVHCQAGCKTTEIAKALGINPEDLTEMPENDEEFSWSKKFEKRYEFLDVDQAARKKLALDTAGITDPEPSELMSGVDMRDIDLDGGTFVMDDLMLDGTITMLIADPKAGKTSLMFNFIKSYLDDDKFLNFYKVNLPMADRGGVFWVNSDMSDAVFQKYHNEAKISNLADLTILNRKGAISMLSGEPRKVFTEHLKEKGCKLLIIDTLASFMGGAVDENSNTEVAGVMNSIRAFMEDAGIRNAIILHHNAKGDESMYGRGAGASRANADTTWSLREVDTKDNGVESLMSDRRIDMKVEGRGTNKDWFTLDFDKAGSEFFLATHTLVKVNADPLHRNKVDRLYKAIRRVERFKGKSHPLMLEKDALRHLTEATGDGNEALALLNQLKANGHIDYHITSAGSRNSRRRVKFLTDAKSATEDILGIKLG